MNDNKWTPFFFESNQIFGIITGIEDWKQVRKAYPDMTDEELLESKEATYNGTKPKKERTRNPVYGIRAECDGEPLSTFFERNNMTLEESE